MTRRATASRAVPTTASGYLSHEGMGAYLAWSSRPLQSLAFLAPALILLEIGALWLGTLDYRIDQNLARRTIAEFFRLFGVAGFHLPALVVVALMLCWSAARRDPWRVQWRIIPWMWLEALIWTGPLVVLALMMHMVGGADNMPLTAKLTFATCAGIYEELLFRFAGIALLHILFVDMMRLNERTGAALALVISSGIFAAYHFLPSNAVFSAHQFAYYFIAGGYLAMIYMIRGFGVVVGAHILFDILAWTVMARPAAS